MAATNLIRMTASSHRGEMQQGVSAVAGPREVGWKYKFKCALFTSQAVKQVCSHGTALRVAFRSLADAMPTPVVRLALTTAHPGRAGPLSYVYLFVDDRIVGSCPRQPGPHTAPGTLDKRQGKRCGSHTTHLLILKHSDVHYNI